MVAQGWLIERYCQWVPLDVCLELVHLLEGKEILDVDEGAYDDDCDEDAESDYESWDEDPGLW